MQTKSLYYAAFKGHSFYSKVIKFFTRSEYSHIAIVTDIDTLDTIEAYAHGSICNTHWRYYNVYKHSPGTPVEIYQLEVEPEQYDLAMRFYHYLAKTQFAYNWLGVIGFVIPVFTSNGGFFCSEGAVEGLRFAGVIDEQGWRISPADFVVILRILGATLVKTIVVN